MTNSVSKIDKKYIKINFTNLKTPKCYIVKLKS